MSVQKGDNNILGLERSVDAAVWMSQLADTIKINGLMIPGSHDAGMSETNHCDAGSKMNKGMVQTQELNIKGQLEAGSRYFDIRVDYDHNELVTYHRTGNAGCNGQPLRAVLDQSVEFIQSHGSETFILKFSHIRSNRHEDRQIKDRIDQFLADIKYREYLLTQPQDEVNLAEMALGDCRGKIILVFDYPEHINVRQGRFRYHDGFTGDSPSAEAGEYRGPNLTVCDSYSKTKSLDKMKKDQLAKLEKFGGLGKKYLFLLSWTLTPDAGTFFGGSVRQLAEEANKTLAGALEEHIVLSGKSKPNIVYIDYFDAATAQNIILYNF